MLWTQPSDLIQQQAENEAWGAKEEIQVKIQKWLFCLETFQGMIFNFTYYIQFLISSFPKFLQEREEVLDGLKTHGACNPG